MECWLQVLEDLEANKSPPKQKFMLGYIMFGESVREKETCNEISFNTSLGTKNMVITDCCPLTVSQKHLLLLSAQKL